MRRKGFKGIRFKKSRKKKNCYVEDLVFNLKHEQWKFFYERIKRNKSLLNKLRILAEFNLENFSDGRDSFAPSNAEDLIEEKLGNRPKFRDILRDSKALLSDFCPKVTFFEKTSNGYRVRFFKAMGPRKLLDRKIGKRIQTEPIYFFDKDNEQLLKSFERLTAKRGVNIDTSKYLIDIKQELKQIKKKFESKEEILHLTHIDQELHQLREIFERFERVKVLKPTLIIPKTEQELRDCFDALSDFQIEVVPRGDAKFLARLFKEKDFKIVVKGPPMAGKSVFAYLVAKEWLGKVGIVKKKLNLADLDLITRENFLVVVDAGDLNRAFDMDLYASIHHAEKLLIVGREDEPRDPRVRAVLDIFTYKEDFLEVGKIESTEEISCELEKMENLQDIINAMEKTSKIKVDDEVKKEIRSISLSSDEKHTIPGFIKAIFIGLASLRSKGEIGDFIDIEDFKRLRASKLKEYKASEKRLDHIYLWLDDDIKKLLKAFRFLHKVTGEHILDKLVVEEAYRAYHGEDPEISIEKAIDVGVIQLVDGEYRVWHPWQVEIIELKKEIRPALEDLITRLKVATPYDKDKRVTLSLAKLLWSVHELEEFEEEKTELLKESMQYFKECLATNEPETSGALLDRVYKKIDTAKPETLKIYLEVTGDDTNGLHLKSRMLTSIFCIIEKNDLIKAWLDFVYDTVIKIKPIFFEYCISVCIRCIIVNENLVLKEKSYWIEYINEMIKNLQDEEKAAIYISSIHMIQEITKDFLSTDEKKHWLYTLIALSKVGLKERYLEYLAEKQKSST